MTTDDLTTEDIRDDLVVLADVLPKLTVSLDVLAKRLAKGGRLSPVDRIETAGVCRAAAGVLRQCSFLAAVAADNL